MKQLLADIAVIGGGPAGLAAALAAKRLGASRVTILERDHELGGILQQCIHDGFGIHRFKKRLSGTQYAQTFIDEVQKAGIEVLLDTMVLEVTPERTVIACGKEQGMLELRCGAVILAMGCRERTASQVLIYGERPAGVLTAGAVQRYINMEGYLPGKTAVILGSGDIGLIMARRMTLEGMAVKGVYEVMPSPGGLTRNVVQCLDDFGIPLYLSTTVTAVHGKKRVQAVTVAKVDAQLRPIPGTEERVECDLLVLAVGLIPENELSVKAGVEMDPRTKGPVLDEHFMTSIPGIFAAGNVAVVFDLVDYVSQSGEIAAAGAVSFLKGEWGTCREYTPVVPAGNVSFVVPQRLRAGGRADEALGVAGAVGAEKALSANTPTGESTEAENAAGTEKAHSITTPAGKDAGAGVKTENAAGNPLVPTANTFFLRVKTPAKAAKLRCSGEGDNLLEKTCRFVAPPEMLSFTLEKRKSGPLIVEMAAEKCEAEGEVDG